MIGPIRVYRVPGSVAFLGSGKIVHPVLPKSRCWCVDGQSKFVMRVRSNNYYRIELPYDNDQDKESAEALKVALASILQYETTACPFKRGFHVELPEKSPQTPKKPWKPKGTPFNSPFSPEARRLSDAGRFDGHVFSSSREDKPRRRDYRRRTTETLEPYDSGSASDASTAENARSESSIDRVERLVAEFELKAGSSPSRSASVSRRSPEPIQDTIPDIEDPEEPSHNIREHQDEQESVQSSSEEPVQIDMRPLEPEITPEVDQVMNALTTDIVEKSKELNDFDIDQALEKTPSKEVDIKNTPNPLSLEQDSESLNWLDGNDALSPSFTAKPLTTTQSATAPVDFALSDIAPATKDNIGNLSTSTESDPETASIASSAESTTSFHSTHSPDLPAPVSPYTEESTSPLPKQANGSPRSRPHRREISELTVTAYNYGDIDLSTPTWPETSPILPSETEDIPDDDDKSFRTASPPSTPERKSRTKSPSSSIRRRLSQRRAHSPLPSPANIYIPPKTLSGHLTNVILQKTCSLLLGPPVQLVALMLNLASRFTSGSLIGQTYTYSESGQPIPCSWGDDSDFEANSGDEDDYGISLGGTPETVIRRRQPTETQDSSWEID
jgi:hypothetical protein